MQCIALRLSTYFIRQVNKLLLLKLEFDNTRNTNNLSTCFFASLKETPDSMSETCET